MHDLAFFQDTHVRLAQADALIDLAAAVKDWKLLEDAVDAKIGEQEALVDWWKQSVRGKGKSNVSDRDTLISVTEAEERSGFRHDQVSRWRTRLKDSDKYREQQIVAALRKVDIGAGGLPAAASSTGPRGITHNETSADYRHVTKVVGKESPSPRGLLHRIIPKDVDN
jgi:hypothetical protein